MILYAAGLNNRLEILAIANLCAREVTIIDDRARRLVVALRGKKLNLAETNLELVIVALYLGTFQREAILIMVVACTAVILHID